MTRLITIAIETDPDGIHCDRKRCCVEWTSSSGFNWFRCRAFRDAKNDLRWQLLRQKDDGRLLRCEQCLEAELRDTSSVPTHIALPEAWGDPVPMLSAEESEAAIREFDSGGYEPDSEDGE